MPRAEPPRRPKQPQRPKRPRGKRPPRRAAKPAPGAGRALLRVSLALVSVGLLTVAVAPVRALAVRAGSALLHAVDAARSEDTRRERVTRYALEYGISFQLAADIERAARAEGVDPELAFRLVRVESEFHEDAVSPVGAIGLTQVMPRTAEEMQPGITREQLAERSTNLHLGFRYFRWLLDVYDGDVVEALHAYNRGPGTVGRIRAAGGDPANGYADRVLRRASRVPYQGNGLLR